MYFKYLSALFLLFSQSNAYKICVFGATSGLGKELVYQSALDYNVSVLAMSGTNKPVTVPCRVNSFQEIKNQPPFFNPNVKRENYWRDITKYDFENAIFTTGAAPFEDDYSDKLLTKVITNLPKSCKQIVLVSAYGVGDSLKKNDIGINIMNNWYLKSAYEAKNNQEEILNMDIIKKKYPDLKVKIFRPRALSYGATTLPSITREDLAKQILLHLI